MPDPLHFYYTRSILGCWVPEVSSTPPSECTRDGRKIRYAGHRELVPAIAAASLTELAARYPLTAPAAGVTA